MSPRTRAFHILLTLAVIPGLLLSACTQPPAFPGEPALQDEPAFQDEPALQGDPALQSTPTLQSISTLQPASAQAGLQPATPTFTSSLSPAPPTTTFTPNPTPPPPDPWAAIDPTGQNIVLWHSQQYDREDALLEIIAEFNAGNPWGIQATAVAHTGQNNLFYTVRDALNTTEAPDLVYLFQNQAATLQRFDGLLDLTSLLSSPQWGIPEAELAKIPPALLAQDIFPTLNNIRLGFPTYRSAEVLYSNLDWLQELGYSGPPDTPAEFKEMACKASQQPYSRQGGSTESLGYALTIDASRFAAWTFAFGGDLFAPETNRYTLDSPSAIQAMQFLQELLAGGCAKVVEKRYADQDGFAQGRILFTLGTSAGIPFYTRAVEENARFTWDVAAPPHFLPEPRVNIYGPSLSILRSTPEKELAAWQLLQHLSAPAAQARWAAVSQYLPVHPQAAESLTEVFAEYPAYQSAYQLLPYAQFEPSLPGYEDVRLLIYDALLDIAQGADVETTLALLNTQANTVLDDQGR